MESTRQSPVFSLLDENSQAFIDLDSDAMRRFIIENSAEGAAETYLLVRMPAALDEGTRKILSELVKAHVLGVRKVLSEIAN